MALTRKALMQDLQDQGFTYRQARTIVSVVITSMTEALRQGESVELPDIGCLEVVKNPPPVRKWKLGRVAQYWKSKYRVILKGD